LILLLVGVMAGLSAKMGDAFSEPPAEMVSLRLGVLARLGHLLEVRGGGHDCEHAATLCVGQSLDLGCGWAVSGSFPGLEIGLARR
jgi:hypothetical protein